MPRVPEIASAFFLSVTAAIISKAAAARDPHLTTRALVEMRDFSGVAISPDGVSVAFCEERASIERNTYDSVWYVQPLDGGTAPIHTADGGVPLRNGGQALNEAPQWSPDSRWIYYRALIDGEVQIWRAARDATRTERVTEDAADIEAYQLSPDGKRLIYRVGATREAVARAEEEEYDRGILLDETIYSGQNLFRSVLVDGRLVSQRTDQSMLRKTLLWNAPKQFRVVELDRLATRDAVKTEISAFKARERNQEEGAVQSPAGRWTAAVTGAPPSTDLRIRLSGGAKGEFACAECRELKIDSLAWRGEDELMVTVRNPARGFAQSLYVWTPTDRSLRRVAASDGLLGGDRYGYSPCAVGRRFAVCVAASAAAPPRVERIDLHNGERRVLYDPSAPVAGRTVQAEFLAWKDDQGRAFTGYLFAPATDDPKKPAPLFVTYYLCRGFLRGGEGDEWPLVPLAEAGIASLCVNGQLPRSDGRDAVEDYNAALAGVTAIVRNLSDRGVIDPRKIGMGGHSFGSEATLWIASNSDLLAAASVSSPAATPSWYWSHALQSGFRERAINQWGLGSPEETPDRWRVLSPAYYTGKFDAPILMQMPEQEFRSAIEYFVKMRDQVLPVELWAFPHEPHIKFQPRHKLAAYDRNLDWFRFWLQNYIDPDPQKADQYRRWNEMRHRWLRERARREADAG